MADKEEIFEILDTHLFSNTYLNEVPLAKKLQIEQKNLKSFFLTLDEELGFIREGTNIFFAQELIRNNIDIIHSKFWKWYSNQLPTFSQLAWQEGVETTKKFTAIKIFPSQEPKRSIIQSFSARIIILGDENVGKHSLLYAFTGQAATQPAPGVFFAKISRQVENFIADIEAIILFVPPNSSLWLYAKAAFGIVLMYDLSRSKETIEKTRYWLETMLNRYSYEFCPPILILGNKLDKLKKGKIEEERRKLEILQKEIEKEYGTIVIAKMISLTTGKNVVEALNGFIKAIREWYIIIKEEFSERRVE